MHVHEGRFIGRFAGRRVGFPREREQPAEVIDLLVVIRGEDAGEAAREKRARASVRGQMAVVHVIAERNAHGLVEIGPIFVRLHRPEHKLGNTPAGILRKSCEV